MNIVHVVRQFHPAVGGFENVVLELAAAQAASGHKVRIVTLNRLFNAPDSGRLPAHDSVAGTDVIRIPFFGSSRYPIALSVLKHLRDADIVHVHCIDFFFDYLAWTKLFHGKTLVVSTHGGFFHTPFAAKLKRLYFSTVTRLSLTSYAGVAAVSLADFDQFKSIRRQGLVCIENGVNTTKYAGAASLTPTKSIISVGRLSTNKRLDRVLSFVHALRRRDPQWTLQIVGRPWDMAATELMAMAERLGIRDAVNIIESPTDEAIRQLMGSCSFMASASEYEGFGVAPIESLSAGLYPLLNDIPPFHHLVTRTGVGMILDFAQPELAAQRVLDGWQDFSIKFEDHRRAAIEAASGFGWRQASQAYEHLYNAATGTKVRWLLNVPIQVQPLTEAADLVDSCVDTKRTTLVAFANAHTLNVAAKDARCRDVLQTSIVFNDGIGVDIASRILFGRPFPENLNGTDFTVRYLLRTKHRYRIYLLGAKAGVIERAAKQLSALCPSHEIVGWHDGYFAPEDNADVIQSIRISEADVILVGMGNPRQELWLKDNFSATNCRLGFAVGALFDFVAGDMPRAPAWVQAARIEWVYRLMQEPRRLASRYLLGNPLFLCRVFRQWWSGSRVNAGPAQLDEPYGELALRPEAPILQSTST
jgi:alpha-1,3-mannosyltransferase